MANSAKKWRIPDGVQDTLAVECYNKRKIEQYFRQTIFQAGYDEIETPEFEYLEVFQGENAQHKRENLIKFIDSNGDILVLRPEMTTPIARLAATKLTSFPARLFYIANAYGDENAYYSSQREYTQAGVELLGDDTPEADAEVIAIAIESLQKCGLQHFQIDIGQVDFFKGLMEEAGLNDEEIETLRSYVDQKNDLAVELFLHGKHQEGRRIDPTIVDTIRQLPMLYGGAEVFDAAEQLSSSQRCRNAISNLRRIYDILVAYGMQSYISVDLGMLQAIDYYSGLIFKGYCDGLGFTILSGGRYDKLLRQFGNDLPATGFAVGIKRVLIALEGQQGQLPTIPAMDIVIGCAPSAYQEAYRKVSAERQVGRRCLFLPGAGREELASKSKGAAEIFYVE